MSETVSRSRAEFLQADYREALRLSGIMLDWRATSVWALLAGLTALSGAIAIAHPIAWLGFIVVIAASGVFAYYRRRLSRTAGERMVALASEDQPDTEWDRAGMLDVPHYLLYPADVATPDGLERLLRQPPADAHDQRADSRPLHAAIIICTVLALIILVVVVIALPHVLDFDAIPGNYAVLIVLFFSVLTALGSFAEVQRYLAYSRRISRVVIPLAEAELARLWAADSSYDGLVVRRSSTGYVLDVTKMSVPPESPTYLRTARQVLLVLGIVVAVLALIAVAVGVLALVVAAITRGL